MRQAILALTTTLVIIFYTYPANYASADEFGSVRYRKSRPIYYGVRCGYQPCRPVGCPDRYSCYSLYGAYGPYGGPAYLTRFTFAGWSYR
jgi:hypothetical protein